MCGIAGFCRPEPLPEGLLRGAADLLAHRGPDACGVRVLPQEGVGFAHRRLSILDLDPRADQPMGSPDGLLITYNGEIYNFRELREDLRRAGASFRTESDTEVLLEGYRCWGMEGILSRAAGMFAFALYDPKRKTLFLARDRAGKKPLFYAEGPGGLAFASELRALLHLRPECRAVDPAGLDAYLTLKFAPSPRTLLSGVKRLPPAHYLEVSGGASALRRYWHPFQKRADPAVTLESALDTAVRRRLVSDVPVCLFLSGGVDSSLIAASLAKAGAAGMKAYSIGYRDLPGYNEFQFSRQVAERFGLRYEELTLDSAQVLKDLGEDSLPLDEPISDWVWVPLHHLSRRAHEDGFKVALLGEGSDELFFGYDVMLKGLRETRRYSASYWRPLAAVLTAALSPVFRHAGRGHHRYDLLRRVARGEPVYMGSSIGFWPSQRDQVAGERLREQGDPAAGPAFIASLHEAFLRDSPAPADAVNRICYVEFFSKMGEVLLQRVDRVTMLHSLEARSPFLDHELVELAFAIPGGLKIPDGRLKGLLKDFARSRLPPDVVDRKKMGFSFPFKEWLRGPLAPLVERTFRDSALFSDRWVDGDLARRLLREHRLGFADHAPRIWMLFSLCRWYDRWIARA
ncbi:MAG: asparagine synthase (glutamine-hydrolyzing) [Elusimicrobiota bacterium]